MYYIYRLLNYISVEAWGSYGFLLFYWLLSRLEKKKVVMYLHLCGTKLPSFQNLSLGFILKIKKIKKIII